ncbi:MAG: ERCC4 domain-containing protein [Acidimicrobiales bacterium]
MFVIARNPDPESALPWLVRVPLANGDLLLKARDLWPRTSRVYCHPLDEWPDEPDVVETVPVRSCVRRGVAIDLVLDRPRENRSQLIFTRLRNGREAIFWQSPRTARSSRPAVRVPSRKASGLESLTILVDSRERYPYRFARQRVVTRRETLTAGDYAVYGESAGPHPGSGRALVAAVERKSLDDLSSCLVDGTLSFQLAELAGMERSAVVVEDRYSKLLSHAHVAPGFLLDLLATLQVRYPSVPIVFLETRSLAEEWTYRFLAAALANSDSMIGDVLARTGGGGHDDPGSTACGRGGSKGNSLTLPMTGSSSVTSTTSSR